jgi:predicted nucleotidyltransferase
MVQTHPITRVSLNEEERSVLERWLELMRAELDLESVWLYGSRARGEGRAPDSDIDLLVRRSIATRLCSWGRRDPEIARTHQGCA